MQYKIKVQANVEVVCLLSKLKSKHHIEVELKLDEMDLTTSEAKATYQKIKDYILERHGIKIPSRYIAQVKQKYGIIERNCYNKTRDNEKKIPQCPPEKELLIEDALKHFKMI